LSAIDAKGRIAIPASLRRKIDANAPDSNFIQLGSHDSQGCIELFDAGYSQMKYDDFRARVEADIAAGRAPLDEEEALDDFGSIEDATVDSSGRFVLPNRMRKEAGTLGGLLATWVTFIPCFLWIFLGAPFIERMRGNKALSGALSAITAAVVGVVLNLAIWFAIHTIFREVRPFSFGPLHFDMPMVASVDLWALAISAAAIIAMFRLKVGIFTTLGGTSAAGVALHLAGVLA
jgi:bifunctional DNA-binding transcriptional regulator/antitoxin component of YhaV-PrlF toxin-antitoxin module